MQCSVVDESVKMRIIGLDLQVKIWDYNQFTSWERFKAFSVLVQFFSDHYSVACHKLFARTAHLESNLGRISRARCYWIHKPLSSPPPCQSTTMCLKGSFFLRHYREHRKASDIYFHFECRHREATENWLTIPMRRSRTADYLISFLQSDALPTELSSATF